MQRIKIEDLLKSTKRDGIDELIKWLRTNNFYTAPASTKYHLAEPRGLANHSWNVYWNALEILGEKHKELCIICGFLHDVCKTNLYMGDTKPYIYNVTEGDKGHAKYSLEIIEEFINLSDDEHNCIKYHMGLFGCYDYNNQENGEYTQLELHKAIKETPIIQLFAAADMKATIEEGK